ETMKEQSEQVSASGFDLRQKRIKTREGTAQIKYFVCEPMERAGFINAFSTRIGGVSPLPVEALNLSTFKGDTYKNVDENRRRFTEAIGAPGVKILTAKQLHSADRAYIDSSDQFDEHRECDALITKLRGVLLGVQTADCLPVLIADPTSGTIAAIHAGWRGTAGRIVERTVADLMLNYGVNTRNCLAALGPSACVECYEVGDDVIERYKEEFGYWKKLFKTFKAGGKAHLDVVAANLQQLAFCGFTEERVFAAPYCTIHNDELFFSYRREGKAFPSGTGRLLSVIGSRERG